ncbi:MAG: alpha-glucan family phosphorylase, partial [Chloroflexota bacterium]
ARRATPYKRSDLIFHDQGRFRRIAERRGPLQVIFAGKAHPRDHGGKALIQRIFRAADQLKDVVEIVYLPDYDMELARVLVSGVDLWLNTPLKPEEASGTSGMKAALNGVPSLSVLDGWWVEGCIEGVTGWSIGSHFDHPSDSRIEAESLYHKLEDMILPMFYAHPLAFAEIRRNAIALNASFFNAERMLDQYVQHAYALS